MSISAQCGHCKKRWKLKDELAGKRIKCPNPDCSKPIAVPNPAVSAPATAPNSVSSPTTSTASSSSTSSANVLANLGNPTDSAALSVADAESLASSLFNDAPPENQQPDDTRTLDITCVMCDHKWAVPFAQQGKNVLCPECKHRQKVPEVKKVEKANWRDPNANRPSLARGPELPEDLKAQQTTSVGIEALKQAGAIPEAEVEDVPLKTKLIRYFSIVAVLGILALGVIYYMQSQGMKRDEQLHAECLKELESITEPEGKSTPLPRMQRAVLHTALIEAAVRGNSKARLTAAIKHMNEARKDLDEVPWNLERGLVESELAIQMLTLAGTDAQVDQEIRIRWVPPPATKREQMSVQGPNVQKELSRVLQDLSQLNDLEYRLSVIRRIRTVLNKANQPDLLQEIYLQAFNNPAEQEYAKSAYTAKPVDNAAAMTAAEAKGPLEKRLDQLIAAIEQSSDPKPLISLGSRLVHEAPAATQGRISQTTILRFIQAAGSSGMAEDVDRWAKLTKDDGVRAWAVAEMIRAKIVANPKYKPELSEFTKPDPKDARPGHLWASILLTRQISAVTGDRQAKTEYSGWPAGGLRGSALSGLLLGLQDKQGVK